MQIAFVRRMREVVMQVRLPKCLVSFCLGSAVAFSAAGVHAQSAIALKSGESTELPNVIWVINCLSIVVGSPQIEILDGPTELALTLKEGILIARRQNCAKPVQGWTVVATAKDVKEPIQAKLTYRIKLKTKIGDRQEAHVYNVSLFP